jgi:hypothetical protein
MKLMCDIQGTTSSWLYYTSLPFCDHLFRNSSCVFSARSGNPVRPSAVCSFAKLLQRVSIKLGILVYTNNLFGEFHFDFIFPSVKHIVTQAYVKL